jgi:hypothetical protein
MQALEELKSIGTRHRSSTDRLVLPPNLFPLSLSLSLSSNSNSRLDSKPKLEKN